MDSSTFEPHSYSLKKLFESACIFAVPEYQRSYSWGKEEVDKLWDDIMEGYENHSSDKPNPYFLGSVIVIDKGNEINDIVDGQQRMTTLTILFDVLNKHNPELNKNKDSKQNPQLINNKRLKDCISNGSEENDCRLRLQSKNAYCSDFESLIIDQKNFYDYKQLSKNNADTPKSKFINTAAIFKDYIEEFKNSGKDIGDFVNYICNNVFVVKISCKNVSFAIKLFQVLNNRGLDLSPADVIKSYLMDEAKLPSQDISRFVSDWSEIENKVSAMENESLSSQFTYYLYYLLGKQPKRTLVDEFEDIIKGKNKDLGENEKKETKSSISVIKSLKNFVEKYDELDDSTNEVISTFFYLPWKTFWATCLLTAKHLEYKEFEELSKILRRFFYISYICGFTLNQLKKPLLDVINAIKQGDSVQKIKGICTNTLTEKEYEKRLVLNLTQKNVFSEAWLKPLFLLLNNDYNDSEIKNKVAIDSHLHAEHILPKTFAGQRGWEHFDPTEGNEWLNSIGNLTLLSYKKNIKASNDTFEAKQAIYQGKDTSGKWSCYEITKNTADFAVNGKWTTESIKKRCNFLLRKLGIILEIDCLRNYKI